MYGYKIKLFGIPETKFACSTSVTNYNWKNHNRENVIEISISKSEKRISHVGNRCYEFTDKTVLECVIGNEKRTSYCDEGVKTDITSVAVCFDKMVSEPCELSRADAEDNSVYLLPEYLEDFSGISGIMGLLNKYISCNVSGTAYDRAMCVSLWFEILSVIDRTVRQTIVSQKGSSENYYVKKLDYIINKRYAEKLSLTDIAAEFGVAMSYLSYVYSKASGKSFRNAVTEARLTRVKELISTTDMSAEDIAVCVGFCDVAYLRKSFKKFFGVSISEYKKIQSGMTLYHEKPVRK